MSACPRARRAGFTLIEMLAVVLIFALLAGLALPNLGVRTGRALDDEATRLAATLEFARQRAVMTGVPHRLVLDLDARLYWLEWRVSEARARGEDEPLGPPPETLVPLEDAAVPLEAPRGGEARFRALPGDLGEARRLDDAVAGARVETPAGPARHGRVEIRFERDGTSAPAELALESAQGARLVLDLGPLADTVGIRSAS